MRHIVTKRSHHCSGIIHQVMQNRGFPGVKCVWMYTFTNSAINVYCLPKIAYFEQKKTYQLKIKFKASYQISTQVFTLISNIFKCDREDPPVT